MYLNLTAERIRAVRDKWYAYVENRKQSLTINSGIGRLKIKTFVWSRPLGEYAAHSWADVFASIDESYRKMRVNDIVDRVFSSSNPDSAGCPKSFRKSYIACSAHYACVT
jgi:hypothetical protein